MLKDFKGEKKQVPLQCFCKEKKNRKIPKTFWLEGGYNIRGFSILVGVVGTKPREK
jgi:hypothetical protein